MWQPSRALRELHHDLRQPLDAIRALAAGAAAEDAVPETVRSCLARITEEAEDLLALCRHVLDGPAPLAVTAAAHVARSVAASCQAATGATVEVVADDVVLALDEVDVRRALWNLLDNAVRAAGPGGRFELTVEAGEEVRLSLADSGPGFAAGPKGTASLGLAIVRRLAAAHGGRTEVGRSRFGGALVCLVMPGSVVVRRADREVAEAPKGTTTPECPVVGDPTGVRWVTGQRVGGAAPSAWPGRTCVPTASHGPGEGRA